MRSWSSSVSGSDSAMKPRRPYEQVPPEEAMAVEVVVVVAPGLAPWRLMQPPKLPPLCLMRPPELPPRRQLAPRQLQRLEQQQQPAAAEVVVVAAEVRRTRRRLHKLRKTPC